MCVRYYDIQFCFKLGFYLQYMSICICNYALMKFPILNSSGPMLFKQYAHIEKD